MGLEITYIGLANVGTITRFAIVARISHFPQLLIDRLDVTADIFLQKSCSIRVTEVRWLKKQAFACQELQ